MDLLFKRYASPFTLIDEMIQVDRFDEFVTELIETYIKERDDQQLWDLYLHHNFLSKSFNEFKSEVLKEDIQVYEPNESELEATIIHSKEMLNSFIPS